ncbi:maltose transporter membrane protein [Photorhabdus temperata subsp. temperata M1021]|nr:maltose transporter membrane protein [Photorhabdus temperata subsp. temperata M1021]
MSATLKKTSWWQYSALKWLAVSLCILFTGYLVVLMYSQGEYLFAMLTLVLLGTGIYVFANRNTYAWRYAYPGIAGMGLFVLFPLICTIAIAFTNYSSTNQLTFERAQSVLMSRQYQSGQTFTFRLYPKSDLWVLALDAPGQTKQLVSEPFSLSVTEETTLRLYEQDTAQSGEAATLRIITQNRQALNQLVAVLPDGQLLRMSSLRQFSGVHPQYSLGEDGKALTNNQTGTLYRPNTDTGFYQSVNAEGQWGNETLTPGFTVSIGWKNFLRVIQDEGIQKPFLSIFCLDGCVCSVHGGADCCCRHGSGLCCAVGSTKRPCYLSRAVNLAVCCAIVYFYPDFQGVI